jgi:hypothetical protein
VLAPRAPLPNLITEVTVSRLQFSFFPPVVNSAATTSPFDSSPSSEPLAPFFLEEMPNIVAHLIDISFFLSGDRVTVALCHHPPLLLYVACFEVL